ncbi:hypothetical protein Z948_1652 [Sulfitobacter donghicola DSW-25 = KCTC 12864 = JCM 14565]|nr:hypothetical protein Z948_1652 [Sulfitobacter donghicola DSW-25 = KCTC 12864 = JCM 14565]
MTGMKKGGALRRLFYLSARFGNLSCVGRIKPNPTGFHE